VRSAKCEVRSAKCEVRSAKCEVRSAKCEVRSPKPEVKVNVNVNECVNVSVNVKVKAKVNVNVKVKGTLCALSAPFRAQSPRCRCVDASQSRCITQIGFLGFRILQLAGFLSFVFRGLFGFRFFLKAAQGLRFKSFIHKTLKTLNPNILKNPKTPF
jgi:hypothetical protein